MSAARERLPPIAEAALSEAQRAAVTEMLAGPRGRIVGPFQAMLRSPELTRRVQKVGEFLRFGGVLPGRLRELAILMTARHWTQHYEWHAHRPLGVAEGLAEALVDAIAAGRRPENIAGDDALVHDFCTEFLHNKSVSDASYARAVARFGEPGVVELVVLMGYYGLLAGTMNVARTALPEGAAPELAAFPT